ncbi:GNAT family N-acetyltransferase [Microbacterium awajiense]|uniref:GNAT family N-acetyltransferase n=1 Tax=Microbacterium awajiense TaxID=415214 RepID=A0ABP7AXM1_9MICO
MEFTLRAAAFSDADEIARLNIATWREAYAHLLPADFFTEEFAASRHALWARVLGERHPDRIVRVAEADGAIVGYGFAGPALGEPGAEPPRDRQLYGLYVAAIHHGTGVGQSLLDAVLGDDPAVLWVAARNPRAIAFYERNGFALDGEEQTDPIAGIVDARMVR